MVLREVVRGREPVRAAADDHDVVAALQLAARAPHAARRGRCPSPPRAPRPGRARPRRRSGRAPAGRRAGSARRRAARSAPACRARSAPVAGSAPGRARSAAASASSPSTSSAGERRRHVVDAEALTAQPLARRAPSTLRDEQRAAGVTETSSSPGAGLSRPTSPRTSSLPSAETSGRPPEDVALAASASHGHASCGERKASRLTTAAASPSGS